MTGVRPTSPIIIRRESPIKGLLDALQQYGDNQRKQQELQRQQAVAEAQIAQSNAQTAALELQSGLAKENAEGQRAAAEAIQKLLDAGVNITDWTAETAGEWVETFANVVAGIKQPSGVLAFMKAVPGISEAFEAIGKISTLPARTETELSGLELTRQQQALVQDFLNNPNEPFEFDNLTQGKAAVISFLNLQGVMMTGLQSIMERAKMNNDLDILARQTVMQAWSSAMEEYQTQAEAARLGLQANAPDLNAIIDETARTMLGVSGNTLRSIAQQALRGVGFNIEEANPDTPVGNVQLRGILTPETAKKMGSLAPQHADDALRFARALALGTITEAQLNQNGVLEYGDQWPAIRAAMKAAYRDINAAMNPDEEKPGFFEWGMTQIKKFLTTPSEGAGVGAPALGPGTGR